ncbi:serine/threonine-protein kinase [Streptomyces sp. NPDC047000]|uniref:serine/threonine-protein kinase n=1 Tax=Streptomyces sp. NPDC047000 TaxID=3155474 RepID=UPI0033F91287
MTEGESRRRVVDGRFELEARLGGGGMGTVWRARDLLLHRNVAVKEVRPYDIDRAEYDPDGAKTLRERVLREARALASVQHPNVVTIHHIVDGGEDTYPWIVMELVDGGSLADRLDRGPMTPAETARLGREVLAALRAAHEAGVQHRDVKPANVLLRRDGRPVLTDFGIAAIREATTLTATGSIIGTPDFMAPERISGGEGGPGSDIWSLAMMLYVAVEGNHPLRRGSTLATLAAVLNEDVPPPVRAGVLTPVLNRVLVRDPAARPDAAELDRLLAAAEDSAARAAAAPPQPTSYSLTPPAPPAPPQATAPPVPQTWPAPGTREPQDAVPPSPAPPTVAPHVLTDVTAGATARPRPPRGRGALVALSAVGVLLVGGVAVWGTLHDRNSQNDAAASQGPGAGPSGTPGAPSTASTAEKPAQSASGTLLTPDGIRTAIKAIEKETGSNRFADFTVYGDYVSAEVMVKGNQRAYDSYTYRRGGGVEKGIISDSVDSEVTPSRIDDYNWDAVPDLLSRARKDLKVPKPSVTYLMIRVPDSRFGQQAGMAVYLTNQYSQTGYLEADTRGKVTEKMPYKG